MKKEVWVVILIVVVALGVVFFAASSDREVYDNVGDVGLNPMAEIVLACPQVKPDVADIPDYTASIAYTRNVEVPQEDLGSHSAQSYGEDVLCPGLEEEAAQLCLEKLLEVALGGDEVKCANCPPGQVGGCGDPVAFIPPGQPISQPSTSCVASGTTSSVSGTSVAHITLIVTATCSSDPGEGAQAWMGAACEGMCSDPSEGTGTGGVDGGGGTDRPGG